MSGKLMAFACASVFVSVARAGWIIVPAQGQGCTLSHLETGWELNVDTAEDELEKGITNLTITSVAAEPVSPCTLPLGDSVPQGYRIVAIADGNGYGASAFQPAWMSITAVTWPDTLRSIGSYAFSGCEYMGGVLAVPEGVTNVGDNTFARCHSLTGLLLPDGLERLGKGAFEKCEGLTGHLVVPGSVARIEDSAFANCLSLTEVTVSLGVTSIGDFAFALCASLTNRLVLPASLTEIGYGAFQECGGLTHVVIPDGMVSLGHEVFSHCDNLFGVVYAGGPPQQAWDDLYAAISYLWPGPTIYYYAPVTSYIHHAWVSAWQPRLDSGSFETGDAMWTGRPIRLLGQNNSWTYSVPGRLTHNLYPWTLEVEAADANGTNLIVTGCILSPKHTSPAPLHLGDPVENGYQIVSIRDREGADNFLGFGANALSLPAALKHIGDHAFDHMNALKGSLVIPSGVTNIGIGAFGSDQQFTGELAIPDSVVRIGQSAFNNCTKFTRLRIGRGIQSIGDLAFASNHGLNSVIYEGLPPAVVGNEIHMSYFASTTIYVFPMYTNGWNAVLASGSFETDDAIWQGRPVKVLNPDGTLGVPARIKTFAAEAASQASEATVTLTWEPTADVRSGYILYGCDNLGSGKWLSLPVSACGSTPSFGLASTNGTLPALGNRFFRIQALP